jgi:hypothetical protein
VDGWPGVFRPLRHRVPEHASSLVLDGRYARRMGVDGLIAYIALCGSPCWPPQEPSPNLPWCPVCERVERKS